MNDICHHERNVTHWRDVLLYFHHFKCRDCGAQLMVADYAMVTSKGLKWLGVAWQGVPPGETVEIRNVPRESL